MTAIAGHIGQPMYMDTRDIAKLIRKDLKAAFQATRFYVQMERYAGGSSIDIYWVDGPTTKRVDSLVDRYRGSDFDGMVDMSIGRDPVTIDGHLVRMAVKFIFCKRGISPTFMRKIVRLLAEKYHAPAPELRETTEYVGTKESPTLFVVDGYESSPIANWTRGEPHWSWYSVIHRASEDSALVRD